MSKEQKDFIRLIDKLNFTLDKVNELSRQSKLDLAAICSHAKQVYIVGPDDIVPLFTDGEEPPAGPAGPAPAPAPRTRKRKKIDLNAVPETPVEPEPETPPESEVESEQENPEIPVSNSE